MIRIRLASLRVLLFGVALVMTSTAATCSKTGGPVVAGVVDCAEQAVHQASLGLIDDVASALATGNWQASLMDLAARFGEAAIDCAVAEVYGTSSAHARMDSLEATKAQRAKQWLDAHPVKN